MTINHNNLRWVLMATESPLNRLHGEACLESVGAEVVFLNRSGFHGVSRHLVQASSILLIPFEAGSIVRMESKTGKLLIHALPCLHRLAKSPSFVKIPDVTSSQDDGGGWKS